MRSTVLAVSARTGTAASCAFEPVDLPALPPRDRRACPYCQCNRNSGSAEDRPGLRRKG
ncbi:hypothetical protein [Streptomyces sp. NPDC048606]|uniref:hypothetical protein n=1 Tax=Streptomyces sp. NPDC048606 TaxID=3154726 RepID=UPI00342AD005